MRFVDAPDARLHCFSIGAGPPLILCHGLVRGSIATWYCSVAPGLARHFRVTLYDQRGHGRSTVAASGYGLTTMAQDLAIVADHETPPGTPLILVGHSYGALIALQFALREPHRVAALILADAPLPASIYIAPSLSASALDAFGIGEGRTGYGDDGRRSRRRQARLDLLLNHTSLRRDIAAAGDIADPCLQALQVPVLCLYGRHSDCRPAGERLAALLPNVQLEWLDAGHYLVDEAPAALLQAILRFTAPLLRDATGDHPS